MKRIAIVILLVVHTALSYAQNLSVDMKSNWYAEVPNIDISMVDSMTLYPLRGNVPSGRDVFAWYYMRDNDYRLSIYNHSQPEIRDPYVFAPEMWRIVEKSNNMLYLTVRDHKDPRMFHQKLGKYRLYLYRTDLNILYKIVMVREYENRADQRIYAPPIDVLQPSTIQPTPDTNHTTKKRR